MTNVARIRDLNGDGVDECVLSSASRYVAAPCAEIALIIDGRTQESLGELPHDALDRGFACAITSIADTNGDGISEIAVGLYLARWERGAPGSVSILCGKSRGRLCGVQGVVPSGGFGFSLAVLDDWNGDGWAELIVGCASANSASVVSGKTGEVLRSLSGAGDARSAFGWAVCALGDVNSDGAIDFAISAPFLHASVQVFAGHTCEQLCSISEASWWTECGLSMCSVRVSASPPRTDLIVSVPGLFPARVIRFNAATGHEVWSQDQKAIGESANGFGTKVIAMGDIDGDGTDDIALGAPGLPIDLALPMSGHLIDGASMRGPETTGTVRVLSGSNAPATASMSCGSALGAKKFSPA